MPKRQSSKAARPGYDESVFINCAFDSGYKRLFDATVFTVFYSGYIPRCALEIQNSSQVRIDKIFGLIEACQFGIHDISRTELDRDSNLPRFNMPLELGMFLGAQHFGNAKQQSKNCLILDREQYRYQQFMSDISGQDIAAHDGNAAKLIVKVRDWLNTATGTQHLPAGSVIAASFEIFQKDTPAICAALSLVPSELTFVDYGRVVRDWLASLQKLRH